MAKEKTIDEAVIDMLRKVTEKQEEIKKAQKRPQWKTNCSIGTTDKISGRVNIQTIRGERELLDIAAFLIWEREYKEKASYLLKIDYDGIYLNYPIADWIDDINTRINMLSIDKKKKELEELDKRVNKLVTSDQRRKMELKALQEILGE